MTDRQTQEPNQFVFLTGMPSTLFLKVLIHFVPLTHTPTSFSSLQIMYSRSSVSLLKEQGVGLVMKMSLLAHSSARTFPLPLSNQTARSPFQRRTRHYVISLQDSLSISEND